MNTRHISCQLWGLLASILWLPIQASAATEPVVSQLVSDESINLQKSMTSKHHLRNGLPVIVRTIPDSDIVQLSVNFASGLKDLPPGRKVLNEWMWGVMPMSARGYPKKKVYDISEKYSFEVSCGGGIEASACAVGTLNEYWSEALQLLAAVVKSPSFTKEDVELTRQRLEAQLKDLPSDPGDYVNEVVNSVFYPVGHPYRLNHDEALSELKRLSQKDLVQFHKEILSPDNMAIVVVTSMPATKVVADLDKAFGDIKLKRVRHVYPKMPLFSSNEAFSISDRELPTAYIRIKFNAPGIRDGSATALRLLFEILSEELGEEIRTKRSLSYAVHAFLIDYSLGIGVINASTSKPEETLKAIAEVVDRVKAKDYSNEELLEYKRGFVTSYYLTQETHAAMAMTLGSSEFFFGDANEYYDLPRQLERVTPAEIKALAHKWLTNFRIGVIAGRKQFKDEWARDLIKSTASKI